MSIFLLNIVLETSVYPFSTKEVEIIHSPEIVTQKR
jgi:hypothetical protein